MDAHRGYQNENLRYKIAIPCTFLIPLAALVPGFFAVRELIETLNFRAKRAELETAQLATG